MPPTKPPSDTLKRLLKGQEDIHAAIGQLHEIVVRLDARMEAGFAQMTTDLVALRAEMAILRSQEALKALDARVSDAEARIAALEGRAS